MHDDDVAASKIAALAEVDSNGNSFNTTSNGASTSTGPGCETWLFRAVSAHL